MSSTDLFASLADPVWGPAENAAVVTKSDATVLPFTTRGLWVGGSGDVAVLLLGGQTVTFTGVVAGTLLPLRVTKVMSTNTTATGIVAVW